MLKSLETLDVHKIVVLFLALGLFACTGGSPRGDHSILILAVPNFHTNDLACGTVSDTVTPQLDQICAESVRLTHAYTPSLLNDAALASLLTGLYPSENGIHHNGPSIYSPGVTPITQLALEKGIETVFVSGGVPALRKSGISKGFNIFDDTIRSGGRFYRPATEVVRKFTTILESQVSGASFLGVLFFADTSFPQTDSGKAVAPSDRLEGAYLGKLQDIDEAVGNLKRAMKSWNIWDQTTVIVVGLSGRETGKHQNLVNGLSLYDDTVRVPLLIKPSRKHRDYNPSWKVDTAVTLVDLGATLGRLISDRESPPSQFPVMDISDVLKGKSLPEKERPLFCESDLPRWRGWGPRLVSLRLGPWLYIPKPEPKLFNSYTDYLQLHDVYSKDFNAFSTVDKVWRNYQQWFVEKNEVQRKFLPFSIGEKIRVAQNVFLKSGTVEEKAKMLADLTVRRPDDWQVVQWQARLFVENRNWAGLHALASHLRNGEAHPWRVLARSLLHLKNDLPGNTPDCFGLANLIKSGNFSEGDVTVVKSNCKDNETQLWLRSYIATKLHHPREAASLFDLARSSSERTLDQIEFAKAFWMDGLEWDFLPELPAGPTTFEMFLSLTDTEDFTDFTKRKQWP